MMGGHHAISGAAAWVFLTAPASHLVVPAHDVVAAVWAENPLRVELVVPLTAGLMPLPVAAMLPLTLVAAGHALAPDMDHHSATFAHSFPGASLIARLVEGAAGGHRKGTHSILGTVIMCGLIMALSVFVVPFGYPVGVFLATLFAVALTVKSVAVFRVHSWPVAFLIGAAFSVVLTPVFADSLWLFAAAVMVGYVVHLLGDALTVGGIPPLFPWIPKPPEAWAAAPVLKHLWQPNGYMGIPILGKTGSVREWAFASLLTAYTVVTVAVLVAQSPSAADIFNLRSLLEGIHL